MKKVFKWIQNHMPTRRRLSQLYFALLYNANIKGYIKGSIYTGPSKSVCVPGMNCYSCPGAVGACPIGSLQNAIANSKDNPTGIMYIIGIIGIMGVVFARWICGFMCPVGLLQDLTYKIKSKKLRKNRVTRVFSYFKYVILFVFVFTITFTYGIQGVAVPAFCKFICPVGTFEGALLLASNPANKEAVLTQLGELFSWKFAIMVSILVASIFIYRIFCRFLCPLGAILSFFNRMALLGVKVDESKCNHCGKCLNECLVDINHVGDHECIQCGRCVTSCPQQAISWKGGKLVLAPNEVTSVNNLEVVDANKAPAPAIKTKKPLKWNPKVFSGVLAGVAITSLVGALLYFNVFDKSEAKSENESYHVYKIGDLAPDMEFSYYNKEENFKVSNYRGKILVLNFWATWCGPCVSELPNFNRLNNELDDVNVVAMHSIEVDRDVQNFINNAYSSYTIEFAQDKKDEESSMCLYDCFKGGTYMPYTVVINRTGHIARYYTSELINESDYTNFKNYLMSI